MDIELLSRMVGELILRHDQVGLPGVGTFVAEIVPASFSDKGYTINPPYRRLSFTPQPLENSLLIDFYAESNHVAREAAELYLTQFLAEMSSVLKERKTILLPGLGRLRATRENTLFFVADEGLDIFPEGVGLRPVSLKSHVLDDDPVVIRVPIPTPPAPKPEPKAEPLAIEVAAPEPVADELALEPADEKAIEAEPEPTPEPPVVETAAPEPADEKAIEAEPEPAKEAAPDPAPVETPVPLPAADEAAAGPQVRGGWPWWVILLGVLLALVVVALATFLILAHVTPDFIDSILYTPEELQIINY